MCFVKYFNCGDFGWFPCGSKNNPVPASQVGFQQIHEIEPFCVEGSKKRSGRGHSSNDLEFFNDRTLRKSFSAFCKLIDAFHFSPRNSGRGASQVD